MGVLTKAMMRLRDEIVTSRHSRLAFRDELIRQTEERRSQVSALCIAFVRDRAGAHRAWFGPTLSERRTGEREQQRELAEAVQAKVQKEQRRQAEEARAKAQAEEQRKLAEAARAKAQAEEQRRLAGEAKAKAQTERQPPAPAPAVQKSQKRETAAPVVRRPAAPLPPAQKPFKGSKKR